MLVRRSARETKRATGLLGVGLAVIAGREGAGGKDSVVFERVEA